MEIMFINYGASTMKRIRIIVPKDKANAKYEQIKMKLPAGGFVSLNKAYLSNDDIIEQGECVRYDSVKHSSINYESE